MGVSILWSYLKKILFTKIEDGIPIGVDSLNEIVNAKNVGPSTNEPEPILQFCGSPSEVEWILPLKSILTFNRKNSAAIKPLTKKEKFELPLKNGGLGKIIIDDLISSNDISLSSNSNLKKMGKILEKISTLSQEAQTLALKISSMSPEAKNMVIDCCWDLLLEDFKINSDDVIVEDSKTRNPAAGGFNDIFGPGAQPLHLLPDYIDSDY